MQQKQKENRDEDQIQSLNGEKNAYKRPANKTRKKLRKNDHQEAKNSKQKSCKIHEKIISNNNNSNNNKNNNNNTIFL